MERTLKELERTVPRRAVESIFETEDFRPFVSRTVRINVLSQLVDRGHSVTRDEARLLADSSARLRSLLASRVPAWNLSWRLCKLPITAHVRTTSRRSPSSASTGTTSSPYGRPPGSTADRR